MILKNVKLSKKRQKQKVLYCTTFFFFFNETSSRDKSTERAYYSSPGDGRKQYLIGVECSSGVMKCLKLERDDGCATLWITKYHWIVHLRTVNIMLCEFCVKWKKVLRDSPKKEVKVENYFLTVSFRVLGGACVYWCT